MLRCGAKSKVRYSLLYSGYGVLRGGKDGTVKSMRFDSFGHIAILR